MALFEGFWKSRFRECFQGLFFIWYANDGARLGRFECGVGFIHQWCEILVRVALRTQQDNGQVMPVNILLVRDAFVRGYEDLELVLGEPQKLAVLFAGPSSFGHSEDLVLLWRVSLETTVHILIQDDIQRMLLDLASAYRLYRLALAGALSPAASRVISR